MKTITLGGTTAINDLVSVARFGAKVEFSKEYEERVNRCRAIEADGYKTDSSL